MKFIENKKILIYWITAVITMASSLFLDEFFVMVFFGIMIIYGFICIITQIIIFFNHFFVHKNASVLIFANSISKILVCILYTYIVYTLYATMDSYFFSYVFIEKNGTVVCVNTSACLMTKETSNDIGRIVIHRIIDKNYGYYHVNDCTYILSVTYAVHKFSYTKCIEKSE